MNNGAFTLAADLVEAGALDVAAACESVGVDPAAGIAGVLAQLRQDGSATTEGGTDDG
ncbi:hypothetical protein K7G68_08885 [Micrococcus luteus]|uniref:hypothetical protein n=1 Tax=Micrococcus luteus TaxID=1270 RepID=UPI001CA6563D|nr:hypothetical protein [Micrococcus luteus]QZY83667.1 hypothetical protein K7G68_08885 [Micrococcus luteus]